MACTYTFHQGACVPNFISVIQNMWGKFETKTLFNEGTNLKFVNLHNAFNLYYFGSVVKSSSNPFLVQTSTNKWLQFTEKAISWGYT